MLAGLIAQVSKYLLYSRQSITTLELGRSLICTFMVNMWGHIYLVIYLIKLFEQAL